MINEQIEKIGRIVRGLASVDRPPPFVFPHTEGDLVELFTRRLDALRAPGDDAPSVIPVPDAGSATDRLSELCRGIALKEILWQGDQPVEMKDYSVGVTSTVALVASTGSVLVEVATAHDAFPSLLVDRHIVVATREQILPDLPAFYEHLAARQNANNACTNLVCITGCSRTADIEKMLVVPAHGPRQVRVILCNERLDWPSFSSAAKSFLAQNGVHQ